MDIKVKGLVLYSKDMGENDKFVTVLTSDCGKISFKARGVKKANSKLKAYVQSFCFCNFELNEKKGVYTLTGAQSIESFFALTTDFDKYNIACVVLEVLDKVCVAGQTYAQTFVDALRTLEVLCYEEIESKLVLCKFLLQVLEREGFAFDMNYCSNCKKPLSDGKVYFSFVDSGLVCSNCKQIGNVEVLPATLTSLKIVSGCDFQGLKTVKLKDFMISNMLKLLVAYFGNVFETKLKTMTLVE